MFISILPIIITLLLIVFLVYKKFNIAFVAIFATVVLCLMTNQSILDVLKTKYMESAANYVKNYFLLFLMSSMFGKVMDDTGAASSIAKFLANKLGEKYAILGVILSGSVLVYGGVLSLVVVFTLYPIALSLFKKANLPRYLLPGAIAGGCFTYAASHFPGTPQAMNVIPIPYLGTTTMAAPVLGIILGIFSMILTCVYMLSESKKARIKGHVFEADEKILQQMSVAEEKGDNVKPGLAILPILVTFISLNIFKIDVLLSLLIGTIICIILFRKNLKSIFEVMNYSTSNAGMAAINTAVIVGYGAAVQGSQGFLNIVEYMTSTNMSPLLSFGLATTVVAGAAGSGSGGLTIALDALSGQYLALGVNPELLHRIGAAAAIGLDSLPHNGAVITLLTIVGMTHKDSYKQIFVTTVLITSLAMFLGIFLGNIMY